VRHLPQTLHMASSSDILMQGANSTPVEVVGLQLTRPKISEALERKPRKTGAGQNRTQGTKPHISKQWIPKGPDLRAVNLSKLICTIVRLQQHLRGLSKSIRPWAGKKKFCIWVVTIPNPLQSRPLVTPHT
jgi:hypothetical protein